MKKLFLAFIVILLTVGVASAANIAGGVDPQNGPEIWLTSVYNNEASTTLDVGDCVEWDIGSSTGDNDNYVIQCDAVDTFLVAGIVYPADIAAGATGSIAIRGIVSADVLANTEVGSLLCSSATGGSLAVCSSGTSDADAIGFATAKPGAGTQLIYIFGR